MIDYTIKYITNTIKILIKASSMASEVVDIRERIKYLKFGYGVESIGNCMQDRRYGRRLEH